MLKSLLTRFKPLPVATLEAGATAGTIAAFTGGEPLTTVTLGAVATLALSVKLLTSSWSEKRADETAYAVDQLLNSDRATTIDLARLFDLPTEGVASNESAFLMLANGLQKEIREHGLDQDAIDAWRADLAELKEIATDTQATGHATLDEVKRVGESVADSRIKDETIASLVKQLEDERRRNTEYAERITELEASNAQLSSEQIVRDVVQAVVTADDRPETIVGLTLEEIDRRLVDASEQADAELRAAQHAAKNAGQTVAMREQALVEADRRLLHFAELRGDVDQQEERIDRILSRYPNDLDALTSRGNLSRVKGDLLSAEADHSRVKELSGENQSWLAIALNNLGLIYTVRGDLDRAEELHSKALEINDQLGRQLGVASCSGNLGSVYFTRGDLERAEIMFRKALAIEEELGRVSQYGNLGLVYRIRGDLEGAERMYRKALAIDEEQGRREGMASQYGNLGLIYRARGDLESAERMLFNALAIEKKLGRREGIANQYGNLGLVYQAAGDFGRAQEMHLKSLAINQELGRQEGMAKCYGNLGALHQAQRDLKEAEKMHIKSLAINDKLGRREGMAIDYGNLGLIYLLYEDLVRAEEMFCMALALNEELGRREGIAKQYGNLGKIREQQGRFAEARELWTRSRDLYSEIGAKHMAGEKQYWIDGLPEHKQE